MEVQELPGHPSCCLPCPATDWLYPDSFKTYNTASEWLNVLGLFLMLFMLVSFAVLPVSKTRRHYLTICLVVSVAILCVGFIIPLGAQPDQCYNQITPNDMYSSLTCAFSGTLILTGGFCAAVWICIRALSMHIQICWEIIPGRRFLYFAHAIGWGVPAGFMAATIPVTGVSFRFGNACHINHKNALAVFWIPLLVIVAIAIVLQLWTVGYCVRVYLRSIWNNDAPGSSLDRTNSGLPSYNASIRAQTARAVFQRLKKIIFLQWRGLVVVTIILADVIFFSVVFVHVDRLATDALQDYQRTMPWLMCLVSNPTNKNACLGLVNSWLIGIESIEAVLLILSLAGLQVFLVLTTPSFITGWFELFQQKFIERREFLPLDANSYKEQKATGSSKGSMVANKSQQSTAYEMQKPKHVPTATTVEDAKHDFQLDLDMKSPITLSPLSSPAETYKSPFARDVDPSQSPAWNTRPGGISPPTATSP